MGTGNNISITFKKYGKKCGVKDVRFNNISTTPEDIQREMNRVVADFRKEIDNFTKHYDDDNVYKSNELITAIPRTQQASGSSVITQINSSSGGSGSSSESIDDRLKRVEKTVTADTDYPEVFSSPAMLLYPPVVFAIVDGMMSAQWCKLTNETVAGFTARPTIDGSMRYAYLTL